MRARILIVVAAIVVGGVAAFAAYGYLGAVQRQAQAGDALTTVLVAKQDISKGAFAADLLNNGMVETVRMPKRYVADGAISSLTAVAGRVVDSPMLKGEVLTTARFQKPADAGLAFAVPSDLVAVTVPVDDARGVSGLIQPGDTVAVLGTIAMSATGNDEETRIMIRGAKVLAVADTTGVQTGGSQPQPSSSSLVANASTSQQSGSTKTVTLALSSADAEKVVFAVENGSIWLALVPGSATQAAAGSGQTAATVLR